MTVEHQVTSLELSKRLKELGVKQENAFYWEYCGLKDEGGEIYYFFQSDQLPNEWSYSAFTVRELGEFLPHCTVSYRSDTEDPENWRCIKYVPSCYGEYRCARQQGHPGVVFRVVSRLPRAVWRAAGPREREAPPASTR